MSATPELARARRHALARKPKFYTRWWFWLIIIVLIVAAAVAWIGVRALQAKQELQSSMSLVSTLKSQVLAQNNVGAKATLAALQPKVARASELTSDPLWRLGEGVPFLGKNLTVVREIAAQTDAVVRETVTPLVGLGTTLSVDALKPKNGSIDLAPVELAVPTVAKATSAIDSSVSTLRAIDVSGTIGAVAGAKTQLQGMLSSASAQLHSASSLLSVLPGALGSQQPRNYLLIFQNNGELMPGGGTVGSMAVLHVDKGSIQIIAQASADPTVFPMFAAPVMSIPADAAALYPTSLGRFVQNLTETPRFPLSFEIAKAMWQKARGITIDGMVSLDTVAVADLLGITGPVPLPDGTQLTEQNAVQTLLIGMYQKYPAAEVDAVNQALTAAMFSKVLSGGIDPKALLGYITNMANEHRLLLWSSNPAEQQLIEKSPFMGTPPVSTPKVDAFGVYLRDMTPSKMEYYLRQSVQLAQAQCSADGKERVRITLTLTNTAPANAGTTLPSYITVRDGHIRLGVTAYAPNKYTVAGITVSNGSEAPLTGTDGEYTAAQDRVTIKPGETQTVTFYLVAGHTGSRSLAVQATPGVVPPVVTTVPLDCAAWPFH